MLLWPLLNKYSHLHSFIIILYSKIFHNLLGFFSFFLFFFFPCLDCYRSYYDLFLRQNRFEFEDENSFSHRCQKNRLAVLAGMVNKHRSKRRLIINYRVAILIKVSSIILEDKICKRITVPTSKSFQLFSCYNLLLNYQNPCSLSLTITILYLKIRYSNGTWQLFEK